MDAASQAEKNVFGDDAKAHPVTGMAIETGRGCLTEEQQAYLHCDVLHQQHGRKHADAMRAKVKLYYQTQADEAASEAASVPLPRGKRNG